MTSLFKAPHLLSSSAASNQSAQTPSSQNSGPNAVTFIEDERRAFLTAPISARIVITVPTGLEITLSADHFNLPTPCVDLINHFFSVIAKVQFNIITAMVNRW